MREQSMRCIQWDVDSLDWKDLSAQEILNRVNKSVQNGSILLFHNNSKHILDALPLVLESLKEKGLRGGAGFRINIQRGLYCG